MADATAGQPVNAEGPGHAPGVDPGSGQAGPAEAASAAKAGPIELRYRVLATAALMAIGVAFGGLMLARGHAVIGSMLVLLLDVLAPSLLLVAPALFKNRRTSP